MKISNASKKVLASALSAAMVVAFAPTAAFAAKVADGTKTVDVTFDANGGKLADVSGKTVQLETENGKYYVNVGTVNAPTMTDGYGFSNWFIDADGDGLLGTGEKVVDANKYVEVAADTTAVTLKAAYTMPTASFGTYADHTYTVGGESDAAAKTLSVTIAAGMLKANHTYTLKVTCPDGTSSDVAVFGSAAGQTEITDTINTSGTSVDVVFSKLAVSTDKAAFLADHMTAGTYTAELSDGSKVISKATTKLVSVDVTVGEESGSALAQLVSGSASVDLTQIKALTTGYVAYLDEEGYSAGAGVSVTVKADSKFTATKAAQAAGAVSYKENTVTVGKKVKPTGKAGVLEFAINNITNASKYAVSVVAPSGDVVYTADYTADGKKTVSFDTKSAGARTTAAEQAGTYVVNVTATIGTGDDAKTAESKSKVVLTQVKYEAGENATFASDAVTSYFTDEATFASIEANKPAATVKAGFAPDYATLNGAKYEADKNDVKPGEVNTYAYVQKAVSYVAAPTYTVVEKVAGTSKQYVLTVIPAEGTTVAVKQGSGTSESITKAKAFIMPASVSQVTLTATAAKGAAKTITLKNATGLINTWKGVVSGASSKFELNIGNSKTKWMASEGVAKAIADGTAAFTGIAGKFFAEDTEIDAADLAAKKALYEAVAAEADTQIAAYKDGANVIVGDKVYYMTAAQYKKATEDAAKDAKDAAKAVKAVSTDAAKAGKYLDAANTAITNTNGALKSGVTLNTAIKAADIAAAQAVNDAIAKLPAVTAENAKDVKAAAEAAIEAYGNLTDDQKKLVSSADYAKAVAAIAAADKAIAEAAATKAAQDKAAVNKVKGKTVKAKAKKATKSSLKVVTSESGAKSTFKKVTKNSKVTVSKNGKIAVKKGLKAGKTYTVKVKATVGTQTKTVKVVVKVAK